MTVYSQHWQYFVQDTGRRQTKHQDNTENKTMIRVRAYYKKRGITYMLAKGVRVSYLDTHNVTHKSIRVKVLSWKTERQNVH